VRGRIVTLWPITIMDASGRGVITGPFTVVRDRKARNRRLHDSDMALDEVVDVIADLRPESPVAHCYREPDRDATVALHDAVIVTDPDRAVQRPSSGGYSFAGALLLAVAVAVITAMLMA
jgi:hypothetical protein